MNYLDENQLTPGKVYLCETYTGHVFQLQYLGSHFVFVNGNPYPNLYPNKLYLDGDVRYVFSEVV